MPFFVGLWQTTTTNKEGRKLEIWQKDGHAATMNDFIEKAEARLSAKFSNYSTAVVVPPARMTSRQSSLKLVLVLTKKDDGWEIWTPPQAS